MAVTNGRDYRAPIPPDGPPRPRWSALCFACSSISLVVALSYTSVAQTLIIMSATPLIAALFGRVFLGEAIQPATWAAIAAVMVGIAHHGFGQHGTNPDSLLGGLFAGVRWRSAMPARSSSAGRHSEISMLPASCLGVGIAFVVVAALRRAAVGDGARPAR